MNELIDKFGSDLAVLAFPCNQFGHQENTTEKELLSTLKHVRPGNNYVPKMDLFCKVDVNGETADPIFKYLKEKLPLPSDDSVSFMRDPKCIIWNPVTRSDIAWNFEKFLIGKDGLPHKRFSKKFPTRQLEEDIKQLLKK
ncbi:glutathione peroxidase 2-like isoform X2 [Procambarus clarkii]|nr:glutathione peroxidase 2-like isoform X2 [Procambarus clarkii]XP_045603856.1 glutathione peroxidase 2-like isoform X2 [Procambarus clarkii]XP_045603857.1 glutathione peroxidase 2-like isoform X2 [Procambarus clarkii]